jgi:hypothetical protein
MTAYNERFFTRRRVMTFAFSAAQLKAKLRSKTSLGAKGVPDTPNIFQENT